MSVISVIALALLIFLGMQLKFSHQAVPLGKFHKFSHKIAGSAIATNEKTVEITGFTFDKLNISAWFVAGPGFMEDFKQQFGRLEFTVVIPTEKEKCKALEPYKDAKLTLKIPADLTLYNLSYIAVYTPRFCHNFGFIEFPVGQQYDNADTNGMMEAPLPCV